MTHAVTGNTTGAAKLVFTTSAQTITAGPVTGLVNVHRHDQFIFPSTLRRPPTFTLSPYTTLFRSRQTDGTTVLSGTPPTVTIAASTSSVSFTYRDTLAGSSHITAADENSTPLHNSHA